ncbi:MAG: hypothetical protein ACI4W2_03760 [Eubacterium sp.]
MKNMKINKAAGVFLSAALVVTTIPLWSTYGTAEAASSASSMKKVRTAAFSQNIRYPVYRSGFRYSSDSSGSSSFYYSDGFFSSSSSHYSRHLASFSMCLALAGFSTGSGSGNSYGSSNISAMLKTFCKGNSIRISYPKPAFYGKSDNVSTIGYALGQRKITVKMKTASGKQKSRSYTLIPVVIRGEGYGKEWAGNVTLGTSGEALGFSDAASKVTAGMKSYIKKNNLQKKHLKFLVTGYSRGGGAANLTAQRLSKIYGSSSVYAYDFEAPQAGTAGKGTWKNIHNVNNSSDLVPYLAPSGMGFSRYGTDHTIQDGSGFSAKASSKIINDILLWSIKNTEGSYRKNYAKKLYTCTDGSQMTQQQALQQLLPMLNSMGGLKLAGFLLSVSELGSRMKTLGFYDQTISTWNVMSGPKKAQIENRLWNLCSGYEAAEKQIYEEKGENLPSLPVSYLSASQKKTLQKLWPLLSDAMLSFAAGDQDGIDRKILTNNLLTIMSAHSAVSSLHLVQGQDSFYSSK